jgi:hypothetical protein
MEGMRAGLRMRVLFLGVCLLLDSFTSARAARVRGCIAACRPAIRRCVEQMPGRRHACRRTLLHECRRQGPAACGAVSPPAQLPRLRPLVPCAGRSGPAVALKGGYPHGYRATTLPSGANVETLGATFFSAPGVTSLYLASRGDVCVSGGQVAGLYPQLSTWSYMHSSCCNTAGIEVRAVAPLIEDMHVANVEDGIRLRPPADGFVIRGVRLTHVFDDAIDDHECLGGTVEDVLSEGSYVGISSRPNNGQDGRQKLLTIRNSLFRLETTDHPYPRETPPAHGALFKWSSQAVQLALHDNIFVVSHSRSDLGIPKSAHIVSCSNNLLVWLGTGRFPGDLGRDPTTGQPCLKVTTDPATWNLAVAVWQEEHAGL